MKVPGVLIALRWVSARQPCLAAVWLYVVVDLSPGVQQLVEPSGLRLSVMGRRPRWSVL